MEFHLPSTHPETWLPVLTVELCKAPAMKTKIIEYHIAFMDSNGIWCDVETAEDAEYVIDMWATLPLDIMPTL